MTTPAELLMAIDEHHHNRIRLEMTDVDVDRAALIERQVNEQLSACGCSEGAIGLVATTGAVLATWIAQPSLRPSLFRVAAFTIGAAAAAGTATGKVIGHRRGRRKARRIAADYVIELQQAATYESRSAVS
ncbi:hypothetical protein [Mycobacterium sp. 852013-50091_SCH5140682]|uniref:hypothetical protein n=1 Tax=Mycobacterium sp. 852013-50091_SCH5140682 TaxID=1834109 RepID=UPI0018D29E90|nr:hypothetical protein [Mycobacterium sp. 852013-50091_SCH5140682]